MQDHIDTAVNQHVNEDAGDPEATEVDRAVGRIEMVTSRIGARVTALAGVGLGAIIIMSPVSTTSITGHAGA